VLSQDLFPRRWPVSGQAGVTPGPSMPALAWRRLAAYTGGGVASGLVNVGLFHVAVHAHLAPHVAWALAFEVGTLVAFVLHRHVTWRDRCVRTFGGLVCQLWRAQVSSAVALVLNLAVFTALMHSGLPGDLDDAAGLAASFGVNFVLAHHYVYGPVRYRDGRSRARGARSRARALHR
jgi:putative flippase GtrA